MMASPADRPVRLTGFDFQIKDLGARPKTARRTRAHAWGDSARCERDVHGRVNITQITEITEITHFTHKKLIHLLFQNPGRSAGACQK
jgi:hypothetical protein